MERGDWLCMRVKENDSFIPQMSFKEGKISSDVRKSSSNDPMHSSFDLRFYMIVHSRVHLAGCTVSRSVGRSKFTPRSTTLLRRSLLRLETTLISRWGSWSWFNPILPFFPKEKYTLLHPWHWHECGEQKPSTSIGEWRMKKRQSFFVQVFSIDYRAKKGESRDVMAKATSITKGLLCNQRRQWQIYK